MKHLLLTILTAMALALNVSASSNEDKTPMRDHGHFAWGAEVGGSIDMSANDMSTIDFTALVGYRRSWMKFLGVGAGMDIMVNSSCRSFPMFANLKTSFSSRPQLLFMDVRAGLSVNYLPDDLTQTGAYAFAGVGFNLASGKRFASHLTLGYSFVDRRDVNHNEHHIEFSPLHYASVRLGIAF
jgi:hypothetical protein